MISDFLRRYRINWALLRTETDRVGEEVERWTYEVLDRVGEPPPPIERDVGGVSASFQIDCYDTLPNGDLAICVDAWGGPPTLFGVKPSYRFFKRRDGTVYY